MVQRHVVWLHQNFEQIDHNLHNHVFDNVTCKPSTLAVRRYLKLICELELYSLQNAKVSAAKDHGKNCKKSE